MQLQPFWRRLPVFLVIAATTATLKHDQVVVSLLVTLNTTSVD